MMSRADFRYKTSLMNDEIKLFSNFEQIGNIKNELSWKNSIYTGYLRDAAYNFKSRSRELFSSNFDVFDANRELVASIRSSNWSSKVTVIFEGRVLIWKPTNFFYTKWELIDQDGVVLNVESGFNKGNMSSINESEFIPFLAMFLKLQYSRNLSYLIIFVFLAQIFFRL